MYNKYRGDLHMKPRVFVSSTFYDLKYIREDLANFIQAHDLCLNMEILDIHLVRN